MATKPPKPSPAPAILPKPSPQPSPAPAPKPSPAPAPKMTIPVAPTKVPPPPPKPWYKKINLSNVKFSDFADFRLMGKIVLWVILATILFLTLRKAWGYVSESGGVGGGSMLVSSNGVVVSTRSKVNPAQAPSINVSATNSAVNVVLNYGDASPFVVGGGQWPEGLGSSGTKAYLSVGEPIQPRPRDTNPQLGPLGPYTRIKPGDRSFTLQPGEKAVIERPAGTTVKLTPILTTRDLPDGSLEVVNTLSTSRSVDLEWKYN